MMDERVQEDIERFWRVIELDAAFTVNTVLQTLEINC